MKEEELLIFLLAINNSFCLVYGDVYDCNDDRGSLGNGSFCIDYVRWDIISIPRNKCTLAKVYHDVMIERLVSGEWESNLCFQK